MEKTSIIIHQAYYGEQSKSHSCIVTSINNADLKSFLTAFTDRPSSLPPGLIMTPYYSGKSYGEFYIFTKTFSDTAAQRGGMVFTHAMIVSLTDLKFINNLDDLFSKFIISIPDEINNIEQFIYNLSNSTKKETLRKHLYVQQAADKLINSTPPIIFCGELINFQNMFSSIWSGLPATFRQEISYSAGFLPDKLDKSKTMVYFQKSLTSALNHIEHISDTEDGEIEITDEVQKFLLIPNIESAFDSFLKELGVVLTQWALLNPSVKAYQLFTKLDQNITADELRLLLRYTARISPNPNQGQRIKSKILDCLKDIISNGADTNIKALRNIPIIEFANAELVLSAAIETFIQSNFSGKLALQHEVILELFSLARKTEQGVWWTKVIVKHLSEQTKSNDKKIQHNLWTLLTYTEASVADIFHFIPTKSEREAVFIETIPDNIPAKIAHIISLEVLSRKWYLLNAHLLLTYENRKSSVVIQLNAEAKDGYKTHEGTRFLLKQLSDRDLADIVFSEKNDLLIDEYGKRAAASGSLLSTLNVKDIIWLKIWHQSLLITKDLTHGIVNLQNVITNILDQMCDGIVIPTYIIKLVAESEFSDLSNFHRRKEVWKKIPDDLRNIFLNASSTGYLQKLIDGGLVILELEEELNNFIADDHFMTQFLSKKRSDINSVLVVYEQVTNLKDRFLADYISYYSGQINDIESLRLGKLIQSNSYNLSAHQAFEKAKHNPKFKIAIATCRSLIHLDIWDKLSFGHLLGESVSDHTVYEALIQLCLRTHPNGPEDKDLWSRAGGDSSKLSNNKTREESWRHAMQLIRIGGGGSRINIKLLIMAMLSDYPNNNQLKEISKYFNK